MMEDLFYFFALPTACIFTLIALAAIIVVDVDVLSGSSETPFQQAEKRRKANERFKEIING